MHSLRLLWAAQTENSLQRRQKRLLRRSQAESVADMPDELFVQHYRLTKSLFRALCRDLKAHTDLKETYEIPMELKVLCALSFLATGSYQRIAGVGHYLTQRTTSRCIREVVDAINHPWMIERWIVFPQTQEHRVQIKEKFQAKHNLPGVIGCIDCTHIALVKPNKDEHLFFNRKGYHSINVQMICDSDLKILSVNSKFGGASHDSHIWSSSEVEAYMRELHENRELVWLLGDSGYPQRPWIMTPILNAEPNSREETYTKRHVQARCTIERCFGLLKARWRCLLKDRVLHYHPHVASKMINACCVLHNISVDAQLPPPQDMLANQDDNGSFNTRPSTSTIEDQNELIRGRALRNCLISRLT